MVIEIWGPRPRMAGPGGTARGASRLARAEAS
jgi:hypothetical protein